MLRTGLKNLFKDRALMNDINVFPVADGDTGDNLYNTCQPLYRSLEGLDCGDPSCLLDHLSDVLLPAARGNSGVIFSQFVYSFIQALGNHSSISAVEFGEAMAAATDEAYQCVSHPKEGTILTVMREAAVEFEARARKDASFEAIFKAARLSTCRALERTRDLLPACKKAGVVDSGAMGFTLFFEGMEKGLTHEQLDVGTKVPLPAPILGTIEPAEHGFCAQWLIEPRGKARRYYFDLIQQFGGSLAIVGDDKRLNIHIHTSKPEHVREVLQAHTKIISHKLEPLLGHHGGTGIVVDSSVDLPDETLGEFGIAMVPLFVFIGDKGYKDRLDLPKEEFYKRLADPALEFKTSQPPPIAFTQACQEALKIYDNLLVLTLSSRLSGTHGSALAGVRMLPREKQEKVTVVDTMNLSAGAAHLVFKALAWVEDGLSAAEIACRIEAVRGDIASLIYLDTLDNVIKSGRIPSLAGPIVKHLGVKPLVTLRDGLLARAGAFFGSARKEWKMVRRFLNGLDAGRSWNVGIVYTTAPEVVPRLEEELSRSSLRIRRLFTTPAAPVLGAHAGPGAFGLFAMPED